MSSLELSNRRNTLDSNLQLKMAEQQFLAILNARLISLEYTIAFPQPDIGEDLWIGEPVVKNKESPVRTIYRAQAKSLYSFEETKREKTRRYEANDYANSFEYSLNQPNFIYFFGIRDERLRERDGSDFHIGCIPTLGFWNQIYTEYPGAGFNGDRFFMQFVVKMSEDTLKDTKIFVNIRRAQNFDVTPYFRDIELGLRVCRGLETVPECLQPVPGRRSPA